MAKRGRHISPFGKGLLDDKKNKKSAKDMKQKPMKKPFGK